MPEGFIPLVRNIWGSGLLFALTLRPGGLGSPQIGGFCGRVAFWGVNEQSVLFSTVYSPKSHMPPYSAFFHCLLPKKPYHPLQCFFPLSTPQKAISPLTVLFSTVSPPYNSSMANVAFWGAHSGKALIAHLSPQKATLLQKPPI